MSLFDLVWIAVIILWILRSVSRTGSGTGEVDSPAELQSDTEGEGAAKASRTDWRDRLLEAAREWEAEQRRQAGEPIATMPAERSDASPVEALSERRRSSVLVRDRKPESGGEVAEPVPGSSPMAPGPARRPLPREEAELEVVATPIAARRPRPTPLPRTLTALERYSPLRRAILYREIFGPPKALGEPD